MIKKIAKKRKIPCLWHFTRVDNLDEILEKGLLPRNILEENRADVVFNDEHRFDGHKDAICFSIGHPNYKMFYSLRQTYSDVDWVVIACDPQILWIKDCAFCTENAASKNVTEIALKDRKGANAFKKLFDEIEGKPSREELGISDFCPTNPQAEILVFDQIEPQYIKCICCKTIQDEKKLNKKYSGLDIRELNGVYKPRLDYEHWKSSDPTSSPYFFDDDD